MKKILILAYDFPPYVSVGGLRPFNWLKYMKEFGVEPVVITRQWDNKYGNALDYIAPSASSETLVEQTEFGTIIRAPFKPTISNRLLLKYGETRFRLLRKSLTAINEVFQFLCISGPRKELYKAADVYLKQNKVDGIIATGEPFVLFYYAKKLGKRYTIPWIADYRDPWSQKLSNRTFFLYLIWLKRLEIKTLKSATAIITVSEFLKFKLNQLHQGKPIFVLPNGYDPQFIDKISILPQETKQLTISFVGTIYEWHPWKSFIHVFAQFIELDSRPIRLNFYGINIENDLKEYIQTFSVKVQDSISIFSKLPNDKLLSRIARENVMLLFNYYSFMGTKIFDYLGVRRKMLLCYSNDPEALKLKEKYYTIEELPGISTTLQADLMQETNSGIIVENEQHLQQVFKELVDEFEATGQIACHSHGVENYSRKIQVQKLAEIINQLL